MKSISDRLEELLTSKVAPPAPRDVDSIASSAFEADGADMIAAEICASILEEEGLILEQSRVADVVRLLRNSIKTRDARRLDRIAKLHSAWKKHFLSPDVGEEKGLDVGEEGVLDRLSEMLLAPPRGVRLMGSKPIKPGEVCWNCSRERPENISFLRYNASSGVPEPVLLQARFAKELAEKRLSELGEHGDVSSCVVIHRGCCILHGSESRRVGDGVAELEGILVRIEFGHGVVLEAEHEVGGE